MAENITKKDLKNQIKDNFSTHTSMYDEFANIQKLAAEKMIASLQPWMDIIPHGPILEIGCGTGFVTELMLQLFPNRDIFVTDASYEMVKVCEQKMYEKELVTDRVKFGVLDGDELKETQKYALIISGFTAQWFKDAMLASYAMVDALKPGGLLLFSFPGDHSFSQWKAMCQDLDYPYTGNKLPEEDRLVVQLSMKPGFVDSFSEIVPERYDSVPDFFRSLKKIGAGTPTNDKQLSNAQMRKLINYWTQKYPDIVEVDYQLVYIAFQKND
ncbi:MAG TPA: methyltransferase [Balneolales bacterium]|nr:methyltransferase [Balneolales bacterium]